MAYNWRGDRQFRLIRVGSRGLWFSTGAPARLPLPSSCNVTSSGSATAGTIAYFDASSCDVESSVISQSSSSTVGIIGLGGSSFTPGTGLSLELRGTESSPGNVQARVTNTSSSNSYAYLSTQAGGTGLVGVVSILESVYDSSASRMGLVGTFSADPLEFVTNQSGSNTAAMWIDTSNDVGIGTTSPVPGKGLTIEPPASTMGTPSLLSITGPAHTGLSGESNDLNLDLARTVTFTTTPYQQRAIWVQAPSYSTSSTLNWAATADLSGPPGAWSGTTVTSSYGLNIEGASLTGGTVGSAYGLSVTAPSGATNDYAAQFTGAVSGAVGNPSGVLPANASTYPGTVFHMDGVKYTSIDSLLNPLPTDASVTLYDDCPGGAETWSYDPFHDSSENAHHVHLISAPCLITTNVPVMLKSGDNWDMTPGGYVSNQTATTANGTVLRIGPSFPAALPNSDAVASFTTNFSGSSGGGWVHSGFYWVALTAENSSGETTLLNGNYASTSYSPAGQQNASGTAQLNVTVPAVGGPITAYCVYVVESGINMFPSNTDAAGLGCYSPTVPTMETIPNYPTGARNPPPGVNTTQTLLTLGSSTNYLANIATRTYVRGGMVDCFGGAIGILNNMAQDPPSGIFDMSVENCTGDALIELEGFDGNLGANGSSVSGIFGTTSNCDVVTGGCTGGINTLNSGQVSVTNSSRSVSWVSGTQFTTGTLWDGADISIGNSIITGCSTNPCTVSTVGSATSLTLTYPWTGTTGTYYYGVADAAAAYPKYGIHDDAVAQLKKIDGFDYGADTCGNLSDSSVCATQAAVRLDGVIMNAPVGFAKVSVHDVHAEGLATACLTATIGAVVEDDGVPATVDGVHGSCQIVYGVQIDDPTYASPGAIHLTDINPYPLPIGLSMTKRNAIYDLLSNPGSPYKSNALESVGEYDIEQPGNFLNPAGPSNFAGGLTVGGPLGTNRCASSASPASCGAASAGSVTIASGGATSVVVDTTAVTSNSQILVMFDSSLAGAFGGSVTCNTTPQLPYVSARTAGTSFTINVASSFGTNPGCFSYLIVN